MSTPVHATNCCQNCQAIDATCARGCEEPEHCGNDASCLSECYASCADWSATCWGIQGQGQYCTWCNGYTAHNYLLDSANH